MRAVSHTLSTQGHHSQSGISAYLQGDFGYRLHNMATPYVQEVDLPGGQGELGAAEEGVQVLQGLHGAAEQQRPCW